MIKLKIEKIDGYNYYLKDMDNNSYMLNIEFYNLIEKPTVNDELYIHEKLLQETTTMFSFGPLLGKYGKEIKSPDDSDLLILTTRNQKTYLKRYYG